MIKRFYEHQVVLSYDLHIVFGRFYFKNCTFIFDVHKRSFSGVYIYFGLSRVQMGVRQVDALAERKKKVR